MNESIEELLASGAIVPDRPGSKRLVPAAPAPSSLAGGEDIQKRVERVVFEDFFGSPVAGSKERLSKALIREFGLAALSPEAPARVVGTIAHVSHGRSEMAAQITAALTPRHEAPAEGAGEWHCGKCGVAADERHDCCEVYEEQRRARSSAPEAREGEAWPERWSGPCTVGNMISNLRTLPPEMPLYSAYHIPMDDQPSLLKVKRPTLSRERVDGTNIKTGDESIPYSAVIWSQPRDFTEATHPAAPSADKLREARQDIINQMADNIEKLALTPAKRELVKAAFRACIGRISTPDALKGDAKP